MKSTNGEANMKILKSNLRQVLATTLTVAATLVCAPMVHASEGGAHGGGGKGFMCNEKGVQKLYLADTYQLRQAGLLDRYEGTPEFSQAIEVIENKYPQKIFHHPFLAGQKVTLGFMLSHVHNGLHFEEFSDQPANHDDDNIPSKDVPAGCKKVQIAWQDLKTNMVQMRTFTLPTLDGPDSLYLNLHETLIALRREPGADTTEIRAKVKAFASILSDPTNFALSVLKEMALTQASRPIVPKAQQTRFKTLYYAPRELSCRPTWTGHRAWYRTVKFTPPSALTFTRKSGDGRVGEENNKYSLLASYPSLFGARKVRTEASEARLYTESYNAFGDADGMGTFDFSLKLMPQKNVEMEVTIAGYDPVTNEYLGSYIVNDTESIRVDEVDSGYGLRCYPSEAPIFRVDERSSVYDK
jgi:hypothetical protein